MKQFHLHKAFISCNSIASPRQHRLSRTAKKVFFSNQHDSRMQFLKLPICWQHHLQFGSRYQVIRHLIYVFRSFVTKRKSLRRIRRIVDFLASCCANVCVRTFSKSSRRLSDQKSLQLIRAECAFWS